MVVSFDFMEIDRMHQLSSVLRETKNARLAVETVIDSLPIDQVACKVCVYTGDCFPAIQDMLKMKGSLQVFPEVKQLCKSAAQAYPKEESSGSELSRSMLRKLTGPLRGPAPSANGPAVLCCTTAHHISRPYVGRRCGI